MAWQYTGLPEVRPRVGQMRGLTHPAEWAAAVAHGKELRALEESLSAHGSHGDENGPKKGAKRAGINNPDFTDLAWRKQSPVQIQ